MEGNRIRKLRVRKGLSLNELSRQTGISKSYLSFLERDIKSNPSLDVLMKIAGVLKVELEYLIEDTVGFKNKGRIKTDKTLLKFQIELSEEEIDQENYERIKELIQIFNSKRD